MHVAGLLDDRTYQAKLEELRGKARAAELPPRPPSLPPLPEVEAPPPLVVSEPGPVRPAVAEPATSTPPPALPCDEGRSAVDKRARGMLIGAASAAAVLLAGAVVAIVALRGHDDTAHVVSRHPVVTGTPDPAQALAQLRTASPSLQGVVMDASDAETLVRAFWPQREHALSKRDTVAIRTLETGAAAQWDTVGCTMGCAPPTPRDIAAVNVFVPRQTTYPAAFMAQVLTTQYHSKDPMVEIMVFTRTAADQRWSLAFDTTYTGLDHLSQFPNAVDGGAFDADAPAVAGIDPTSLPGQLAGYWEHWKDTGSAPPGTNFLNGAFTSEQGVVLRQTLLSDRADGIADAVTYTPDTTSGVWTFAVTAQGYFAANQWALTCGTVRYAAVSTSTRSGGTIVQDQSFQPFGTLLPPGGYSSVTEQGLHQSCFLTGVGANQVEVIGDNGATTRITAVIAHAPT